MKDIVLKQQEVKAILNQLISLPMHKIENLVIFFRSKLEEAEQSDEKEKEK